MLEDLLRVLQQYQNTRNAKRALQQSLQHACLQYRTKMVLRGFQSARLIAPRFCLKPVLLELLKVHFPWSPSEVQPSHSPTITPVVTSPLLMLVSALLHRPPKRASITPSPIQISVVSIPAYVPASVTGTISTVAGHPMTPQLELHSCSNHE